MLFFLRIIIAMFLYTLHLFIYNRIDMFSDKPVIIAIKKWKNLFIKYVFYTVSF